MSTRQPRPRDTVRLHVVTGKGGTGKTTMAAALALALASTGRDVLLCEVEGRQGIAQLFDVPPLPYAEERIAVGRDTDGGRAGAVYALAIDVDEALTEYLAMYYHLGRAAKALEKVGAYDFATTIAPGIRDVLLTGKVYEATKDRRKGKGVRDYDAVVLDAPPTGRIARFLNTNAALAGLAKVGPIKNQADAVSALMRSPRTAVHLVTVLEEMPVQETADGIAELRAADLPVGAVLVNMVRPRDLGAGSDVPASPEGPIDREQVEKDLVYAGLDGSDLLVDGLLAEAREHAERRQLEDEQRSVVEGLDVRSIELPRLASGVDLGGLYELAAALKDQGLVPDPATEPSAERAGGR